ncbi:Cof-type HAD-IIB family hydrolase [Robertmurraya korlensis]|uniref:Cof-type HAD-IIB family hydrolase n=1 Tax=Robertmurraya korlensis TaxID=519977 RepID=UPI00203D2837|nr:Cof-type HAD-IIB family hydrolase [Robertmurraya korlensis]MCM3601379.1 Cof-type HAD-IIB family hydrolase [Robertmurraya korlensis]
MCVKCVALDLDGTLLNSEHEVSAENEKTIRKLQEQGVEVILNTGRAYADVVKVNAIRELNCPILTLNGSALYGKDGSLLYETTIPVAVYKEMLTELKKLSVGILVYTNHGGFPCTLPGLRGKSDEELKELFLSYDYDHILQIEDLKIFKCIAVVSYEELERIQLVKEKLSDFEELTLASSFPNNVEIMSKEAHKGKAIQRYALMHNHVFSEIYAFGDGGNDLPMFEISTASVAMENAPTEVKEKATYVTKSNDEDGVSHAIYHILKLL